MGLFSSKYKSYSFWNSTKLYGISGTDYRKKVIQASILTMKSNPDGFYKNFARQVLPSKASLMAFYRTAHTNTLPTASINVIGAANEASIKSAIVIQHPTIDINDVYLDPNYFFYGTIPPLMYFAHEMTYADMTGTYDWTNDTITFVDPDDAIEYTDWEFSSFELIEHPTDPLLNTYDVTIARPVPALTYWIEGPDYIIEGNTRTYTLKLNRAVDVGASITFNVVFAPNGDATPPTTSWVEGTDYTATPPITFVAGEQDKTFDIVTLDNAAGISKDVIVTLEVVPTIEEFTFAPADVEEVTDETIEITGHGQVDAAKVRFYGADLPDPLVEGTVYYVVNVAGDTFQVETSIGNGAIDFIDQGTGVHTAKFGEPNTGFEAFSYITPRVDFETFELFIPNRNGKIITIPEVTVFEADTTVAVTLKLEEATTGTTPFSVVAYTAGESAIAVADFTDKEETLNFAGTAGETKTFNVDINIDRDDDPDSPTFGDPLPLDDDFATFRVKLKNCSLPEVDISMEGAVVIRDNTEPLADTNSPKYYTYNKATPPDEDGFFTEFRVGHPDTGNVEAFLAYENDPTYAGVFGTSSGNTPVNCMPTVNLRHNGNDLKSAGYGAASDEEFKKNFMLRLFALSVEDLTSSYSSSGELGSIDEVNFEIKIPLIVASDTLLAKLTYNQFYEYIGSPGTTTSDEGTIQLSRSTQFGIPDNVSWNKTEYEVGVSLVKGAVGTYYVEKADVEIVFPISGGISAIFLYLAALSSIDLTLTYQRTASLCDTITIRGLRQQLYIAAPHISRAVPRTITRSKIEEFQIPLTFDTLFAIQPFDLLEIYPYLYTIDSTTVQVVKVKWYQQKWFKIFLIVVRVVIAVVTLGASEGIFQVIFQLVIQQLLFYGLAFILNALGVNEFLSALIITVASIYAAQGADGFSGLLNAEALTKAVTQFSSYVSKLYQASNEQIADDLQEAKEEFEERSEEIKAARESLASEQNIFMYSPDTMQYMAIEFQTDFDILYDVDRMIGGYLDNATKVGVI